MHVWKSGYIMKKMQYRVKIKEVHVGYITVMAKTEEEALDLANEYIADNEVKTHYLLTMDEMDAELVD